MMEYITGTKVLEEWQIKRLLGEGANGKVFEIEKSSFGVTTQSALKVIRIPKSVSDIRDAMSEGLDEQSVTSYFQGFVEEIVKEIAVMASLKGHPNIVSCEDYRVVEHTETIGWDILIRMELLTSLTDYQIKHPFNEKEVLRLGKDIASALVYCQKKGLIHRDIKPQNVFVSSTGQFKLGDFGVARTVEKTMSGLSRKGTESYMAPEVYRNEDYGPSVDIYSLGLMLYGLLNHGRLPFLPLPPAALKYSDREAALARRMRGDVLPMPACASEELGHVILKACQHDPEKRYRTAEEFLQALEQIKAPLKGQEMDEWDEEEERTVSSWENRPSKKRVEEERTNDFEERTNDFEDRTVSAWDSYSKKNQMSEDPVPVKKKEKGKVSWIVVAVIVLLFGGIGTVVLGGNLGDKEDPDSYDEYYGEDLFDQEEAQQDPVVDDRPAYLVTVWDGDGSGEYRVGDPVTVSAVAPEGYSFVAWYMPTKQDAEFSYSWYERAQEFLGNADTATVSFEMPQKEVKLRAFYIKTQDLQMQQKWIDTHENYEKGLQWFGENFSKISLRDLASRIQGNGFLFFTGDGYAAEPNWDYSKDMMTIKAESDNEVYHNAGFSYHVGYSLQWDADRENAEILERVNGYAPSGLGIRLGDSMASVMDTLGISDDMLHWIEENNVSTLNNEVQAKWVDPQGTWSVYDSKQADGSHRTITASRQSKTGDMWISWKFERDAQGEWYISGVYLQYRDK